MVTERPVEATNGPGEVATDPVGEAISQVIGVANDLMANTAINRLVSQADRAAVESTLVDRSTLMLRTEAPEDGFLDAFLCPITQDYMRDPVVNGQTYVRNAIEHWFSRQLAYNRPSTSLLTGELLEHTQLVPNIVLRGLIRDLLERHPELVAGAAFPNF